MKKHYRLAQIVSAFLLSFLFAAVANASEKAVEDAKAQEKFILLVKSKLANGNKFELCETPSGKLDCRTQIDLWLSAVDELISDEILADPELSLASVALKRFSLVQKALYFKELRKVLPNHKRISILKELFASQKTLSSFENYIFCENVDVNFCGTGSSKYHALNISTASLRDLYQQWPDLSTVENGKYAGGARLYMFCRSKREYPCLLLMKDPNGNAVLDSSGAIWSQPKLAYSRHKKGFNEFSGNTPSGVFLVDGVMPKADQPLAFGKFRRLVLNFVAAQQGESLQKSFLPQSSHTETWWNEGVIARDMGRSAFRIHGTGTMATDKNSTYYPFYGTSGCMASRENTYDGTTYRDQRLLLDKTMQALSLNPVYDNEPLIRGVLYVVDIDDQAKAVTIDDLRALGVL